MATKPFGQGEWIDDGSIVDMLKDRKWRDLVVSRYLDAWQDPDLVLHRIRAAIYHVHDCIEHKSVPFLEI